MSVVYTAIMNVKSEKFKYLSQAKRFLPEEIVPDFELMTERPVNFFQNKNFILRSALENESHKEHLGSGKSLSIPDIDSLEKAQAAWDKIQSQQKSIQEIILQVQVDWEKHLTVIAQKDFFFAEILGLLDLSFLYWTPLNQATDKLTGALKELLETLSPLLSTDNLWLLEIGEKNDQLYLFQVHPISPELLQTVFSNDLAKQILISKKRFEGKIGVFSLLKNEWLAKKFRQKMLSRPAFSPADVFLNWEFIFHYFRLHCMLKNYQPTAETYAAFLSGTSAQVLTHFKIANILKPQESYQENLSGFTSSAPLFMGKGSYRGLVENAVIVLETLGPEKVYAISTQTIILTTTVSLLSHGVLAAMERGNPLVTGLPLNQLQKLKPNDQIYLDFERKIFQIQ